MRVALSTILTVTAVCQAKIRRTPFFEDFASWPNGMQLDVDPHTMLIAKKQWGGNNGGVLPENLFVEEGVGGGKVLRMRALGNCVCCILYQSALAGAQKSLILEP